MSYRTSEEVAVWTMASFLGIVTPLYAAVPQDDVAAVMAEEERLNRSTEIEKGGIAMLNIKAAVVREKSAPFIIEDLSLDDPRPEEVLVRIVATGVCHTDMVVRDQEYPVPLPLVLGHEGAGIVEKVGAAVKAVTPGDHVVLSYGSCGRCANCEQGKPGYCVEFYDRNFKGARLDGSTPLHAHDHGDIGGCFFAQSSFATHALVTERNAIKIPKDVPLEIMGPLGCGIQTGAGAVINVMKPQPGASLAI